VLFAPIQIINFVSKFVFRHSRRFPNRSRIIPEFVSKLLLTTPFSIPFNQLPWLSTASQTKGESIRANLLFHRIFVSVACFNSNHQLCFKI